MKESRVNDGKTLLVEFDSWGDWLEYSRLALPKNVYHDSSIKTDSFYQEFTLTPNYDKAIELALVGWEEKVNEARTLSELLINKILDHMAVPTIHYDVEGIDFDMSRVHQGEPECWYRFEEHVTENEGDAVVRIVINNMASCGVETDTIIKRGAVIAALVETLEYAHRRVELVSHSPFAAFDDDGKKAAAEFKIMVKTASQPLDLARLMFMSGHPSMLRRLLFHALEMNVPEHTKCGSCYGYPTDLSKADQGNVYFGKLHYGQNDRWLRDPEGFIIEQLQAQGVEVKL